MTLSSLGLALVALTACAGDAVTTAPSTTAAFVEPVTPGGIATTTTLVASAAPTSTISGDGIDTIPVITIALVTDPAPLAPGTPIATAPLVTAAPQPPPCAGTTTLPESAEGANRIVGNVDGDDVDDTVTAYTATDGTPHVFLQRGGLNGSDVALPIGTAGSVRVSFEDVDAEVTNEVVPPMVVMAISVYPAGAAVATATATLLSVDRSPSACLRQWTVNGSPFTFVIDQRGPYTGLLCDGVRGKRFYVLRTATSDGLGNLGVSSREIDHDGAIVALTTLGEEVVPDTPEAAKNFGDIHNCDHPPLFP
jgi:hypothetical protein